MEQKTSSYNLVGKKSNIEDVWIANMGDWDKKRQAYVGIRVGYAYAEYAVHADYAHMREYADADENLIHIIHI